jgi:hypothetical protein
MVLIFNILYIEEVDMNINSYIDKKQQGAEERLEIALAEICVNAEKHLDYQRGLEHFKKTCGV